jgi:hypothetical protein
VCGHSLYHKKIVRNKKGAQKQGRAVHAAMTLPSDVQRQLKLVAEPLNLR